MASSLYLKDVERIIAGSAVVEAANERENEAKAAYLHDRTDEARHAWKQALQWQQEAHTYYWTMAREYVEVKRA